MSQSALQLENYNTTMSVALGGRAVTPVASPTSRSHYGNGSRQAKGKQKKAKLHKSALSLRDLPPNSKSFTGTIRSTHQG